MGRVYNFSAGPAVLPEEVLREAAEEMLDYRGTGMSVMEMSHRSKTFQEIIDTARADLRGFLRNRVWKKRRVQKKYKVRRKSRSTAE